MEIKKVNDYYDKVQEEFPDLDKKEIEKILKHGLRSMYLINTFGGDVLFKNKRYTMYMGALFLDMKKFWEYWRHKLSLKLRILYKRRKNIYDGYYYFGLSEEDYIKYGLDKKKGRKSITFDKIYVYKIMEESFLDVDRKYFFKLVVKEEGSFKMALENFKTNQFSLIAKRDSDKKVKLL